MKSLKCCFLAVCICCLLACSKKNNDNSASMEKAPMPEYSDIKDKDGIINLDALPSSMRYSYVYSIIASPKEYAGAVLKITGKVLFINPAGQAVIAVYDMTGCCIVPVAFSWSELKNRASVKQGQFVTVTGTVVPDGDNGFHLENIKLERGNQKG